MLERTTPPSPNDDVFWEGFSQYLKTIQNAKVANDTLRYAQQYNHILSGNGMREMLQLSPGVQRHIMKSMSSLSKYMGCYDQWKLIKERYQLKWSQQDSLETFHRIVNNEVNYKSMIEWLKTTCRRVPASYPNILIFDALTGLRASEALMSIKLVQNDLQHYLRQDSMILEHYKYREEFLRRTKKAYVTVVDDSILEIAKNCGKHSYIALRMVIEERGLQIRMGFCRKIFSTHLRMNGVESELIDLLQGRIPNSVFAKHYFRPDFDNEMDRVRRIVEQLHKAIAA